MNIFTKSTAALLAAFLLAGCGGSSSSSSSNSVPGPRPETPKEPPTPIGTCPSQQLDWVVGGNTCIGTSPVNAPGTPTRPVSNGDLISIPARINENTGTGNFVCVAAPGETGELKYQADNSTCEKPLEPVPPPSPCGAQTVSWQVGNNTCQGISSPGTPSNSNTSVVASIGENTGNGTFQCLDGALTYLGQGTCNLPPKTCSSKTVSWTIGGKTCTGTTPPNVQDQTKVIVLSSISGNGTGAFICDADTTDYLLVGEESSCQDQAEPVSPNLSAGFFNGSLVQARGEEPQVITTDSIFGIVSSDQGTGPDSSFGIFTSDVPNIIYTALLPRESEGEFRVSVNAYQVTSFTSYMYFGSQPVTSSLDGEFDARPPFTISATREINDTDKDQLVLTRNSAASNVALALADIAGTYEATDSANDRSMSIQIAANGAVTGTEGTIGSPECTIAGTIEAAQVINAYSTKLTITCQNDSAPFRTTTGVSFIQQSGLGISIGLEGSRGIPRHAYFFDLTKI